MTGLIVTLQTFLQAMRRQKLDRVGMIEPTQADATIIYAYAQRILPLRVQGEALFWEGGGKVETPKMAAMALALHQAEPEMFVFPDCQCGKYIEVSKCHEKPDQTCGRRIWLDRLRERAAMPGNVPTPPIPVPERGLR